MIDPQPLPVHVQIHATVNDQPPQMIASIALDDPQTASQTIAEILRVLADEFEAGTYPRITRNP